MDADRIYSELQTLAVGQAELVVQQAAEGAANLLAHDAVTEHLERSNGDLAELRRDFDEKAIVDAETKGRIQGTLNTLGIVMSVTAAFIAAGGTVTGIAVAIAKWGG